MIEVVGIRFKEVGKIYYFDPCGLKLDENTKIIAETVRGLEFGSVVIPNRLMNEEDNIYLLKNIIRVATDEDVIQDNKNKKRAKEAFSICLEKIKEHELDMKLIDSELTFDCNKIMFYFTSKGRVDFRNLVKDLAAIFRMRIELRQIGVRDEAKILSSIGMCGKPLCCATFLGDFQPVSIKMAKDQGLSLNPAKISGVCGRLMCCLMYEEENYTYLNKTLPKEGYIVSTVDGEGEVLSVNVLRQLVKVSVRLKGEDSPTIGYYDASEISILRAKKSKVCTEIDDKELKKLID